MRLKTSINAKQTKHIMNIKLKRYTNNMLILTVAYNLHLALFAPFTYLHHILFIHIIYKCTNMYTDIIRYINLYKGWQSCQLFSYGIYFQSPDARVLSLPDLVVILPIYIMRRKCGNILA